ncbi:glycine betaine ABC transporter substrate-binding protein [Natronincola ferrireducens]|nr:glycine betaine ABC transporter substrate-binding protein [Natronincola ferrireducens]
MFGKYHLKYLEDSCGVFGDEEYCTPLVKTTLNKANPKGYIY